MAGIRSQWMEEAASLPYSEKDFGPSMVEPVYNVPLEQMIRDYSRGILHNVRVGSYDPGSDVVDVNEPEDLSDLPEESFEGYQQMIDLYESKSGEQVRKKPKKLKKKDVKPADPAPSADDDPDPEPDPEKE